MSKALPKWTDERTENLQTFVGDESPVSQATVAQAAEHFETSARSISSKLRKLGFEVELASANVRKAFSDEQAQELAEFVEANSGAFTYGEIAEHFGDGEFTAKQIQGKILSLELTEHVRPTPKPESVKTYSDAEEATFIRMAAAGAYLEEIAEALNREVNSVRGKALSLLRIGTIEKIPAQRDRVPSQADPIDSLGDLSGLSVEDIAERLGKTVRGVKTMLTRRGLVASNYDGASRKEKAAS
jgi:DNA-binding CsgD family transcriptional regulator